MLRITVELLPFGQEERKKVLGIATIGNDRTGTVDRGNYLCTIYKGDGASSSGVWKRGKVLGFPRQRLGPWDLLYRALREMISTRNKT